MKETMTTLCAGLEQVLRSQIDAHHQLLHCLDRKREAVRTAKIETVSSICDEERIILLRISEMDAQRQELARRIMEESSRAGAKPVIRQPVPLSAILERMDVATRARFEALAAELKQAAQEVRQRSSTVRAAAESLARHMSGVMQTVQSALSKAGVYGRRGVPTLGAQLDYSIDLRT